jgi:starch synthase
VERPADDGPGVILVADPLAPDAPVYGGDGEGDRFARFARAVTAIATDPAWVPEVVHANDWHTALVPVYLGMQGATARSVLTIHNLAYQGRQGAAFAGQHGLPAPPARGDTGPDDVNVFGRGIAAASAVTTVSVGYAREILEPIAGHGLDGLLRERGVTGITNGIDVDVFDPATDGALAEPFDAARLAGREAARADLAGRLGLDADGPLIGVVSRLAEQKGLDILLAATPALLARGARIVVLGSGERWLEDGFQALAAANPTRIATSTAFDDTLARRIYAGSDLFAMPSRFEPCGLGQLIAMRYGALPLARRTGGITETVPDNVGYLFDHVDEGGILWAFDQALADWSDGAAFRARQARAMAIDSSWDRAALRYEALYRSLTDNRRA